MDTSNTGKSIITALLPHSHLGQAKVPTAESVGRDSLTKLGKALQDMCYHLFVPFSFTISMAKHNIKWHTALKCNVLVFSIHHLKI